MRFGHTQVNSANTPAAGVLQTFEYRCTFRVVSYTNTTINISFVTSGQLTTSADVADPIGRASFQVNQVSENNVQITTKNRTLDGKINLSFYIINFTDADINFSRYTSYIKRIV